MDAPARTLAEALQRTEAGLLPGAVGVVGLAPGAPDTAALLEGPAPRQVIVEAEEVTALLPWDEAQEVAERVGAPLEGPFAWLRFETPMAWELVGFLARVTGALAEAGVSLGAVCGYSRDHLFVPWEQRELALEALEGLGIRRAAGPVA